MNKNIVFIFLLIFSCTWLHAQQTTFKIDYGFHVSEELKNIDFETETDEIKKELAMTAALAAMFLEGDQPVAELWVNDEFIRINSSGPMKNELQITNKTTGESFMLYPDLEQYSPAATVSDKMLDMGDDFNFLSEMPVTYIDNQTKEIAGYSCSLAQIHMKIEGQAEMSIDIWYSKDLPTAYWGEYPYLEQLPGAALEISTNGLGVQATQIDKITAEENLFDIPSHYTLVEFYSEFDDYSESYELAEDRFIYTDEDSYLSGIMDADGNPMTEALYLSINPFQDGIAVASTADFKYGALDLDGKVIIPFSYDYLQYDNSGKLFQFQNNELYGLLDIDGKTILEPKYDYIGTFEFGKVVFINDEKYGILDSTGKEIIPATHDMITSITEKHFVGLNKEMEFALFAISTNKRVSDFYDIVSSTAEPSLFAVSKDDQYGYINTNGEVVIPIKYEHVTWHENNLIEVFDNDTEDHLWYNVKGEIVEAPAAAEFHIEQPE